MHSFNTEFETKEHPTESFQGEHATEHVLLLCDSRTIACKGTGTMMREDLSLEESQRLVELQDRRFAKDLWR